MLVNQIKNCQFHNWYSIFKKVTVKSCILEVPDDVLKYLLVDGLVLPHGDHIVVTSNQESDNESDEAVDWESSTDVQTSAEPKFDEFEEKVKQCINELGGTVFPKLNWSSPKDAAWISFDKTLKCHNLQEIFLLLKSSDFVTHDLTTPFDNCEDYFDVDPIKYHLVLRKWIDISPEIEFRCFVQNNAVTALSQRHCDQFYPSIISAKPDITKDILLFFDTHINGKFPDSSFVFDVVWNRNNKLVLLDFNPFGGSTDGLLFSWDELFSMSSRPSLEFRCVEIREGVKPYPYQWSALPQDFLHLTTGMDPEKFLDLLHLKTQNQDDTNSE